MRVYKDGNIRTIKIKINVKATNRGGIHKNLIEEWKLKRRLNLYHWFIIGITFSNVKKIFGSVVNLHYENTLFKFLFNLEGKLPINTELKF